MHHTIRKASDIGGVIRAARKAQRLRQDDAAGSVGVSLSFINKAEGGSESVQWGKLFQILEGLGVKVTLDIPDASEELVKTQSRKAQHRAAVRDFRTAERLVASEPGKGAIFPASSQASAHKESNSKSELVHRAAERLVATQPSKNSRAGMTLKRARQYLEGHEGSDQPRQRSRKIADK